MKNKNKTPKNITAMKDFYTVLSNRLTSKESEGTKYKSNSSKEEIEIMEKGVCTSIEAIFVVSFINGNEKKVTIHEESRLNKILSNLNENKVISYESSSTMFVGLVKYQDKIIPFIKKSSKENRRELENAEATDEGINRRFSKQNPHKQKPAKEKIPLKVFDQTDKNKRINKILSSPMSTQGIINTFEELCVPFDKECERKDLYLELLHSCGIDDAYWDDSMGIIVPAKKKLKKTVVSHMDLIKLFNKGFRKGRVITSCDGEKLTGPLDNTITNAILMHSLFNKRNKNTAYLFTLDEETNQFAMRDYMKKFGKDHFVINLDVTWEGINERTGDFIANSSVEYDEPNWQICKSIEKNLDTPIMTKERVGDDFDRVVQVDGYGFSYCLPTGNEIHSYKNWCYVDSILPYYDGLNYLIHELDVSDMSKNMEHVSIEKALKIKTIEELDEANVRKIPYAGRGGFSYDTDSRFEEFKGEGRSLFEEEDFFDSSDENIVEIHFDFIKHIYPNIDADKLAHSLFDIGAISVIDADDEAIRVYDFLQDIGILVSDVTGTLAVEYDFDYSTKYMRLLLAIVEKAPNMDVIEFHDFYANHPTVTSLDLFSMFKKTINDGTIHFEVIELTHFLHEDGLLNQDDKVLEIL